MFPLRIILEMHNYHKKEIQGFREGIQWPTISPEERLETLSFGPCTFVFPSWLATEKVKILQEEVIIARSEGLGLLREALPQDIETFAKHTPLVLWDTTRHQLKCFAHPLGRGTFFYCWQNDRLLISTSLPDLAASLNSVRLDPAMVAEYFALGRNTSSDQRRTFLQGLSQVPAGHCLEWCDGHLKITAYWNPQHDPLVGTLSLPDAVVYVRESIERVIEEVEPFSHIGCLVSGGLDSSLIAVKVHQRVRRLGSEVVLFTAGHSIDSPEERQLQQRLAKHLHMELVVPEQSFLGLQLEPLRALNRSANAPSGGLFTGIDAGIMQEAAQRGISLLFGGEGGDEVFHTNPQILADLLLQHRWKAAIQASLFFTSLDGKGNFLRLLLKEGLSPLLPYHKHHYMQKFATFFAKDHADRDTLAFLIRFLGGFDEELASMERSITENIRMRHTPGFSFSLDESYQQMLTLPYYEACWPYAMSRLDADVHVMNPLSDLKVFRAAMSLRLDQRVGTWVGFRSKYLLRLVAEDSLPQSLRLHAKVGVSDLITRMTQGMEDELVHLLQSDSLAQIGIDPPTRLLDPRNVPSSVSLYWVLLLLLVIWFEELKNGLAQRRR